MKWPRRIAANVMRKPRFPNLKQGKRKKELKKKTNVSMRMQVHNIYTPTLLDLQFQFIQQVVSNVLHKSALPALRENWSRRAMVTKNNIK